VGGKAFCPRCGGYDIGYVWTNAAFVRFGAPLQRRCGNCGYRSWVFPDEEVEDADAAEEGSWGLAGLLAFVILLFLVVFYLLYS